MLAVENNTRGCARCGKNLKGRSDKKFCDDYCRSAHNNERRGPVNNLIRNVNGILGKNRRILEQLLPDGEANCRVSREKLLQRGFHFGYITHTFTNNKGNVYFYCYEYGYLPLEHNGYLIVRRFEKN